MFKTYKNILTKEEQENLFNFAKNKVENLGPNYPGLQSKNNLHTYKELSIFLVLYDDGILIEIVDNKELYVFKNSGLETTSNSKSEPLRSSSF